MITTIDQQWSYPLGLFDAFGVELEYMIVDRETLDVRPVCDQLFRAAAGAETSDFEPDGSDGLVSWSNELALHVIELKTQHPAAGLDGLVEHFDRHVRLIEDLLEPMGCRLMPTGMHPWMDPDRETRLWPHENNEIYRTYDKIFGCRGHGWGNLQSTHINLPFANEDEFGRLHAALRVVLPLLPAIAASSPIVDGAVSALADHRMEVYRTNSTRVPMMAGLVVPEPVFTREAYEVDILGRLYEDLRPLDPGGILRHEFANARGAMARFDRGAIEIRVLDIQECPLADVTIAALVIETVRGLVEERWSSLEHQASLSTGSLHSVLLGTIRDAERTRIEDRPLLEALGASNRTMVAGELWSELLERVMPNRPAFSPVMRRLLNAGTLSTRILSQAGRSPSRDDLRRVFAELSDCLREGRLYRVE